MGFFLRHQPRALNLSVCCLFSCPSTVYQSFFLSLYFFDKDIHSKPYRSNPIETFKTTQLLCQCSRELLFFIQQIQKKKKKNNQIQKNITYKKILIKTMKHENKQKKKNNNNNNNNNNKMKNATVGGRMH